MTQQRKPPESPGLFDLPLDSVEKRAGGGPPADEQPVSYRPPEELSLFSDGDAEDQAGTSDELLASPSPAEQAQPPRPAARFTARCIAGLVDLGLLFAVALALALGTHWLGVDLAWRDWPALLVVLLSFSFLYLVPPLAFWGRTLGMRWAGLIARANDDQPLTFHQTVLRWLGAVLTLAACGLPLLLSFTGASLADRLSRSGTFREN